MNSRLDLLVWGGQVVTPDGVRRLDVGVADGRFAVIGAEVREPAGREIDATGLTLFPGILDAHVHFNEPGRTEWEGLASGSAALAAGGGTWFCDMPLNSSPPVTDAATFNEKRGLAEEKSLTDFSLWGGLVPGNLDKLEELRDAGAVGVKAFMCDSGLAEFPAVDTSTLRAGMKRAAALGMIVAVHAEDGDLAESHARMARGYGDNARAWLFSRPVELELTAIRTAIDLAGETGCALHIVHVSSPPGVGLIADAKRDGVNISAETCPHYLLLDEDDLLRIGAVAKCAPPLRSERMRRALWNAVETDAVDTIGSDHSPAPPEMKTSDDFFAVWGGISGCQHGFPLLLSEAINRAHERVLPRSVSDGRRPSEPRMQTRAEWRALPRFAALLGSNVARRFRLPQKGTIAEGFDADFSLLDLRANHFLNNRELLYRHLQGPYDQRQCRVKVRATFSRGVQVTAEGGIAPDVSHRGRFIRPQ